MAEVEKTPSGVLVFCDCGLVHKLSLDETTDEVKIETKFKKKEDAKPKEKPKSKSIFG